MRHDQRLGISLPPTEWVTCLAMDMAYSPLNLKTWAVMNRGANPVTEGRLQVSMLAIDATDADWFNHPDASTNMPNIAAGAWASATASNHAFAFYRLQLRSTLGTTVDVFLSSR